jgi:hypothetical protein
VQQGCDRRHEREAPCVRVYDESRHPVSALHCGRRAAAKA